MQLPITESKNLKSINWNHLYYFYEVAKALSLKKAAGQLGLASSTLSEQLKKLEECFQNDLFKRGPKGLILTDFGHDLFERSKIMFEEGSKLVEYFSNNEIGGYQVNVGIEESVTYDLATEFCSQYWDIYTEYGTVNTIRQTDHQMLTESILSGHLDWGITIKKPTDLSICHSEIGSFNIVFCCSRDLYDKFKNEKDLLSNIPFAQSSWDKSLNEAVYGHLSRYQIHPKEKIMSDHPGFIKKLCDRGRCVMYAPENPLGDYSSLKKLEMAEPLRITIYAVWKKKNEKLIAIKKLKELIQFHLSDLPFRYQDVGLQIEACAVEDKLLN